MKLLKLLILFLLTHQKHETFYFLFFKSTNLSQHNNKTLALKMLKNHLELYPLFDQGWLLFGSFNELLVNLTMPLKDINNVCFNWQQ